MTNQTPAPKASSAAALLASFGINSPKTDLLIHFPNLSSSADEDFSSFIHNALTTSGNDRQTPVKISPATAKEPTPASVASANPDPLGLLLPMLLQAPQPQPAVSSPPKLISQLLVGFSKGDAKTGTGAVYQQSAASASSQAILSARPLFVDQDAKTATSEPAEPDAASSPDDQKFPSESLMQSASQQSQPLASSANLAEGNGVPLNSAMSWKPVSEQNENPPSEMLDSLATITPLASVAVPTPDGAELSSKFLPSLDSLAMLPKAPIRKVSPVSTIAASKRARGADSKPEAAPADSKTEPAPKLGKASAQPDPNSQDPAPDGTSVAISGQRMNFVAQKNEYAGSAEQNLPLSQVASVPVVDTATDAVRKGAVSSLDFFWRETPAEVISMVNLAAKPGETGTSEPVSISASATPVARLEQMISHEALTIRQTGAQSLGVSLKLDDNTHLFLQLTTNNGTIQASLRCEKGDFSALDSQWAQLQASLARQNVQLLPVSAATQSNFQQTSQQQQQQRQFPQQQEDGQQANLGVPPTSPRQQKNPNARRSRPDREFWA